MHTATRNNDCEELTRQETERFARREGLRQEEVLTVAALVKFELGVYCSRTFCLTQTIRLSTVFIVDA